MKITLITGNHPRHFYLADQLCKIGIEILWIIETRENHIPIPDDNLKIDLQNLFKLHFKKREEAEYKFFTEKSGDLANKKINKIIKINREDISNGKLEDIIILNKTDILIAWGCHFIPNNILNLIKIYKWNVHGGLNPWYRGNTTHFWPTYLLEPELTGMTLHELTDKIDGGDIIHQTSAKINKDDGIHENASRVVKEFSDNLPILLKKALDLPIKLKGIRPKSSGRIWTSQMWNPLTLKVIYELFEDKINEYCLENKKLKKPKLISLLN
tara:strand:+ start:1034 stop:1843 length:810 start_codon:yes stop_codon:yes gene_type:complete